MDNNEIYSKSKIHTIVDASFILANALSGRSFNQRIFIENCRRLRNLRHRGARIIDVIRNEVEIKLKEYASNPEISKCLDSLFSIREWDHEDLSQNDYWDLFRRNIKSIGENVSLLSGRSNLSKNDIKYCTFALLKSKNSDIIVATRDKCIMDTLSYAFAALYPVRKQLSWADSSLFFAWNYKELINQIDLTQDKRRLSVIHSNFEFREANPLESHTPWQKYAQLSRKVWQERE